MQLTRFDRWLREKFVYETHVFTMREVEPPPRGVAGFKIAEKPGQRFRFKYVARSARSVEALLETLRKNSMMYTTRVENRKGWYVRYLAPAGKSPTWWLFSTALVLSSIASAAYGVHRLWSNPEIRQNLIDSIEILKQ